MSSYRLVLIAHAETAATQRAAFATGREPLAAAGLVATRALRAETGQPGAKTGQLGAVLTSPALAAWQTAEALGLMPETEPALRDLDFGSWAGRTIAEVPAEDLADWSSDPGFARHGGESLAALADRIEAFLATRHRRGTTLAITHAAIVRAALVATMGAPIRAFWRIDVPPLHALTLGSDGRRWTLRAFGRWGPTPAAIVR